MNMRGIYQETRGSGDPIVLWHGWGMNLRVFEPLTTALMQRFSVMAMDLPGHGRSAWREGQSFEAALPALLAALPERCTLVGWSMGGLLALRAAQLAPGRLRALVLLNSTPKFVADAGWTHGIASSLLDRFASSLQLDYAQTLSDFLDLQVRGNHVAPQFLAQLRQSLHQHGDASPAALAAGLELLRDCDLRKVAAALRIPTIVCSGQYDRVTPPGAGKALAALVPGASYVEIPRSGHAGFLSHAQWLAGMVGDWLDRSGALPS